MNRRRFLALTGAAALAPLAWRSSAQADSKFDFATLRPQIDEKVSAYMDANGVPGVAIGIVFRETDGTLHHEYFHYGVASKKTGRPMDESSIVLTNSISKAFTGSLLAINLQRGAMKLDDPIQRYLPEIAVPKWGDIEISLKHVATHRSGLLRDMPGQLLDLTGKAHLKFLEAYELTRIPGVLYEYSNYAFSLLGIILSRSMGASYEELVAREFADPLGMPDTREVLSSEQTTRLADNYMPDGAPSPHRPLSVITPSGGLYSTTPDLLKFLGAHIDLASAQVGSSVEQALQRHYTINANRGAGLGWEVDFAGTPNEAFWKSGGSIGATSQVWFARELNYGFAILTNRGMPAQNGLPLPNSSPADAISSELRRILTAAARA